MSELSWKAAERCVTTAFPYSELALAKVKLRLDSSESPTTDEIRHLEESNDWDRLAPELFFEVDVETLTSDTALPENVIAISVVVRDRVLNKFEQISEWPLDNLPDDAFPLREAMESFSLSSRLDIAVMALPREPVTSANTVRIPKGTLLSTKVFKIRIPGQGHDFPIKFVEPEEMKNQGLSGDTAFYVYWKSVDLQRTPSEVVEVWLNKELEDKFRILSIGNNTAADHIGRNVAAQVYGEILAHVLAADETASESTSLVSVVENIIERKLGIALAEARRIYQEGPGGRSKLMPWCWKLTNADRAFSKLKL